MRIALGIVAVIIAAVVASASVGVAAWERETRTAAARLGASSGAATVFAPGSLDDAPAPVARYFTHVLRTGQPLIQSAVATQDAEFFINGGWRRLTATQYFAASPSGFVWDARIEMAPLLPVYVRDAYAGGRGSMRAGLYGLYTFVDQADRPELNAGALQRLVGEAVWFPTMLLPSATVRWTERDDRSATVTLTDAGTTVSLLFEFNADGDVVRISGDRYKESGGAYTLRPWVIACGEHAKRGGMRVPLSCEVAWVEAGGPQPYWRGRIVNIEYRFEG